MKCKICNGDLIGKEKFFCKSCWTGIKDTGGKVLSIIGGTAALAFVVVVNKGKISNIFKK